MKNLFRQGQLHALSSMALCFVFALTTLHCGPAEESSDKKKKEEKKNEVPTLPEQPDHARLETTLQELSADAMLGRLTGLDSGDMAAQYLVEKLQAANVEPSYQDVVFPLYEVEGPAAMELLDANGNAEVTFSYIDDFREVDFSGSGNVTAEVTFVGYGLVQGSYDSYESLDVTGKIAAVLTGIPAGQGMDEWDDGRVDVKINNATTRGAVGVIFVLAGRDAQSASQKPKEHEMWAQDKYGDLHQDLLPTDVPVAFVSLNATERLMGKSATQLKSNPAPFDLGKQVRLEINGTTHPVALCQNIFGVLEGEDDSLKNEVIILGAHYDHLGVGADGRIYNGAADNATGTAIVLEVLTSLALSKVAPKRTLMFAFWCAEEQGLHGSYEYGHYGQPLYPLSQTKLMIQVDYIGELEGPYITNYDGAPMVQSYVGDTFTDMVLPLAGINWGGECASDDCVFLFKGVPAYRFISYGEFHHIAEDTFENLNLPMVNRVADINLNGMIAVGY